MLGQVRDRRTANLAAPTCRKAGQQNAVSSDTGFPDCTYSKALPSKLCNP